jgi:hypothetical protein
MLRGKKGALAATENAANRARAKGSESTYVAIVAAVSFGAGDRRAAPIRGLASNAVPGNARWYIGHLLDRLTRKSRKGLI